MFTIRIVWIVSDLTNGFISKRVLTGERGNILWHLTVLDIIVSASTTEVGSIQERFFLNPYNTTESNKTTYIPKYPGKILQNHTVYLVLYCKYRSTMYRYNRCKGNPKYTGDRNNHQNTRQIINTFYKMLPTSLARLLKEERIVRPSYFLSDWSINGIMIIC